MPCHAMACHAIQRYGSWCAGVLVFVHAHAFNPAAFVRSIALCCAVLCCAVLFCAVLRCAVLCCAARLIAYVRVCVQPRARVRLRERVRSIACCRCVALVLERP
eukprot:11175294-Lingulodinium_polyedra.AAC.1